MRGRAGITRTVTILGLLIVGVLAFASPASAATVETCRSGTHGLCVRVDGSGNHMNRIGVRINLPYPFFKATDNGHIQARWHAGGVDHFRNSGEMTITNADFRWLTLNVNVDPNTYVCGRFWVWDGRSWTLPYGDWQCILTHP